MPKNKASFALPFIVMAILISTGHSAAHPRLPLINPSNCYLQSVQKLVMNGLLHLSGTTKPDNHELLNRVSSQNNLTISSTLVGDIGKLLISSSSPSIRSAAAKSIGDMAGRYTSRNSSLFPHEPQLIKTLSTAFAQENNPSVRCSIVRSAAMFNHPEAAILLNRALEDRDASVRKEAQRAKRERQRRQFAALRTPFSTSERKK